METHGGKSEWEDGLHQWNILTWWKMRSTLLFVCSSPLKILSLLSCLIKGGAFLCGPVPLWRPEQQKDLSRLPCGSQPPFGPTDDLRLWQWTEYANQWQQRQWSAGWSQAGQWAPRGHSPVPQTGGVLCHVPPSRDLPGGQDWEGPARRDYSLHWTLYEELRFC